MTDAVQPQRPAFQLNDLPGMLMRGDVALAMRDMWRAVGVDVGVKHLAALSSRSSPSRSSIRFAAANRAL